MNTRGRPSVLTAELIGEAVIELGIETFSVKALAAHLQVSERTLYNYASNRSGLVALGMEHLMRNAPRFPVPDWSEEASWREILEQVAETAWDFVTTSPQVGMLIARGTHTRVQMEFTTVAGTALMDRGFTADQAIQALAMVFELVTTVWANEQRMDVPGGAEAVAERDRVAVDLAPAGRGTDREREFFAAMVRGMWEPRKDVLDRRLAIVLDGVAVHHGTPADGSE